VTVESEGQPTSDACGGAGSEEDRGGRDEDACGGGARLPVDGAGLMAGTSVYRWTPEVV
jgi:hypothetical protein